MIHYIKKRPFIGHLIAYVVIILALALLAFNDRNFSADLQDNLIQSCEANGNPLREEINDIEKVLDTVLAAARTDPVLYPPPAVTAEEQRFIDAVERGQEILNGVENVDCEEAYDDD